MNRFIRPLIGAVIGFVVFGAIALLASSLYYRFMPGDWFVNYYYVKVDDSEAGKDVQFTSCRTLRGTNIRFNATRTFLLKGDNDNQFIPIGEYTFEVGLEKLPDTDCRPLRVPPEKQPQQVGTYKLITEGTFKVNGYEKAIRYESNEYKITPTVQSLESRILELQKQINELKAELALIDQSRADAINNATQAPVEPVVQQNNTSTTQQPTSPPIQPPVSQTEPQSSQQPKEPANASIIQQLLNLIRL